jgi:hypothetical protein
MRNIVLRGACSGHRRQERRTRCLERRDLRRRIDAREQLGF